MTTRQRKAAIRLRQNRLRGGLQELTLTRDISRHPVLLEELRRTLPNSIRCLSAPSVDLRYNCVMYALGMHKSAEYVGMAMQCPEDVHASTSFLRFLIDAQETAAVGAPYTGAMCVYLERNSVKHVGLVVADGRIQSKWGIGHLYDHLIKEVPESYGSAARFYKPIDPAAALKQFERYAVGLGVVLR